MKVCLLRALFVLLVTFTAAHTVGYAHDLQYSTYLRGNPSEQYLARTVRLDASGNVYIAGHGALTAAPTASIGAGESAEFTVAKFSHDGSTPLYSTLFHLSANDNLSDLAVSPSGEAYVAGGSLSCRGRDGFPFNGFLLKLDRTGSAVSFFHCLDRGDIKAAALDASGNVYITGTGVVTRIDTVAVTFDGICGTSCTYVAKFDASGNFIRGVNLQNTGQPSGIAIDVSGNIHLTGTGQVMPTVLAYQRTIPNRQTTHVYYLRLSPNGGVIYATYLAGSSWDYAGGIAVDSAGNAWIAGETLSPDFPTVNPLQAEHAEGYDVFLAKISPSGSLVFSTYLGGNADDISEFLTVDAAGTAYVSATVGSSNLPVVHGLPSKVFAIGQFITTDAFIWAIDNAGTKLLFSTYVGGTGTDSGHGIAVDDSQRIYFVGDTATNNFPVVRPYLAFAEIPAAFFSIFQPQAGEMPAAAPPAAGPAITRIEQDDARIVYQGDWPSNSNINHSGGTARLEGTAGARATLTFTGTGIGWSGFRDEYSGIAKVYIDGQLVATVDTYASPTAFQAPLFSKTGLADVPHTFAIEVAGTKSTASRGPWIWVDALEIVGTPGDHGASGGKPLPFIRVEQTSSMISYAGPWSTVSRTFLSGGSAALALPNGAQATFTFVGTQARFIGFKDSYAGIVRVYVDGIFQTQIDTYSFASQANVAFYTTPILASGTHTLTVEATGTRSAFSKGNWVWVDAFEFTTS